MSPGGKISQGETAEECAVREVLEETGLKIANPQEIGVLNFFKDGQRKVPDWTVHVFLTTRHTGAVMDGREGILRWFVLREIPFEEMWEDDRFWYSHVLERRRFEGDFYFEGDFEKLSKHDIRILGPPCPKPVF